MVEVLSEADEERDTVSLATIRNLLSRVDSIGAPTTNGDPPVNGEVTFKADVSQPGGFHGNRVRFQVEVADGIFSVADQTALLDSRNRVVYVLIVGCERSCFARNLGVINRIIDSWTVREH